MAAAKFLTRAHDADSSALPSRTDYQVWMAMQSVAGTLEQLYFPAVYRWISNMADLPIDQMVHWGTPKKSTQSPSSPSTSLTDLSPQFPTTPLRAAKKICEKTTSNRDHPDRCLVAKREKSPERKRANERARERKREIEIERRKKDREERVSQRLL